MYVYVKCKRTLSSARMMMLVKEFQHIVSLSVCLYNSVCNAYREVTAEKFCLLLYLIALKTFLLLPLDMYFFMGEKYTNSSVVLYTSLLYITVMDSLQKMTRN